MSAFFFDGRSRQNNMRLTRESHVSRDRVLDDAHRRRQQRELERQRLRAAVRLQSAVRRWQAQQVAVCSAIYVLDHVQEAVERHSESPPPLHVTSSPTVPTDLRDALEKLEHACWCYHYLQRHQNVIPVTELLPGSATWRAVSLVQRAELQRSVVQRCAHAVVAALRSFMRAANGIRVLLDRLSARVLLFFTEVLVEEYISSAAPDVLATFAELATSLEARVLAPTAGDTRERYARVTSQMMCVCLRHSFRASAECRAALYPVIQQLLRCAAALPRPQLPERLPAEGRLQDDDEEGSARGMPAEPHRETEDPLATSSRSAASSAGVWWDCLTAPPEAYLSLTESAVAVLLSLELSAAETSAVDSRANARLLSEVVHAAYQRIVVMEKAEEVSVGAVSSTATPHPSATSSSAATGAAASTAAGGSGGASAPKAAAMTRAESLAVLGRLTRCIPFFLQHYTPGASEAALHLDPGELHLLRQRWLSCIACLLERLCQTPEFIERILFDLHHPRRDGIARASLNSTSAVATAEPVPPNHRGRYYSLISHLFSAEGGLLLLAKLAEDGEASTTSSAAAATVEGDEARDSGQANLLLANSPLELLCSAFAWPLLSFSFAATTHRLETTAIFAKLLSTPQLLQRIWRLYCMRCSGLRAALPSGEGTSGALRLDASRADGVVRLPTWVEPPAAVLAATGCPRGRSHLFWDPHPALSVLCFTLLNAYVDVVDFAEELERQSVFSRAEATALVLALKTVVHRSHFYGVVPHCNGEAVAHVAFVLLSKLHAVDEARPFLPAPHIWIATTSPVVMGALGAITITKWEDLARTYAYEREHPYIARREERRADGENGGGEADDDEESRPPGIGAPAVRGGSATSKAALSAAPGQQTSGRAWRHLPGDDDMFEGSMDWAQEDRVARLLLHAPFLLPFAERAALFTVFLLSVEHQRIPGMGDRLIVHRGRTFVDAFDRFQNNPASPEMFSVRFANLHGELEEGYGHGVYREFMVSLCKEGFAAEHGLFRQTEDGFLYPNPFSYEVTGDPQHLAKISFLGTMVGRALRDGILQDVPFALHFRNALLGRRNSINNLRSFDAQLYKQLMLLTSLDDEEMSDMGLTFTYTVNVLGVTHEVELIRGGGDVLVTRRNCLHYIHLVADFKLNREGAAQTRAFQSGLQLIIDPSWLQLFDSNELLNLFGGDQTGRIDCKDWREHTVYNNPADASERPVVLFWQVVDSLTNEQRGKLLKFATSMKRPPLLGFRFLSPPFKIDLVRSVPADRLPSASTCFSTLKLPSYEDYNTARAKIIAAIEETDSFGLS